MRAIAALLLAILPTTAAAQPAVTSPAPDRVELTVYRDPNRGGEAMDLSMLDGFALISERRRIRLPAGTSTIRFEGVAGGIVPQSAIVTGFPEGIVERNRDAYLLSPGTLIDRSLGRRVHLRRTDLATGAVREQEAVIRSGADGGVVLQTAAGIEALRCAGGAETLVYDELPGGLTAKPTLSVVTRAAQSVDIEVTLSYLATGFDWQANYIAELSDDERHMRLFAWMTLGSNDETSFVDADAQAVAGRPNYTRADVAPAEARAITLRCWPAATTSDIPLEEWRRIALGRMPEPLPGANEIVVTGTRIYRPALQSQVPVTSIGGEEYFTAEGEALGDLKLYRIPERVTVAANSQKQVALLVRDQVPVQSVYRVRTAANATGDIAHSQRFLVTRNREQDELGVPLPSGPVAAFISRGGAPFLIGQGDLDDRAVGEDVEIAIGGSAGVRLRQEQVATNAVEGWADYQLTVTSDQSRPVRFEAELLVPDDTAIVRARLPERDGMRVWAVTVPANGTTTLRYRVQRSRAN